MSLQTTLLSGKKRLTSWNPCRSLVPAVGKAKEADEGFGEPSEGPIEDHPKGGRSEIPPRWAAENRKGQIRCLSMRSGQKT